VNPFEQPNAYGKIKFGPFPGPGSLVDVDGADRPYGWDKTKGTGTSGATNKYTGVDIADSIKTTHHLTTVADFTALAVLRKGVSPPKGKTPSAFDVENAHFTTNNIVSIALKKFGQEKHLGGGLWSVVLEWTEEAASKPTATGPVAGSKSGTKWVDSATSTAPTAKSGSDKELDKLLKQAMAA